MSNKGPQKPQLEAKKSPAPKPPAADAPDGKGKIVEPGSRAPQLSSQSQKKAELKQKAQGALQKYAGSIGGNFDAEHAGRAIAELIKFLIELLAMLFKMLKQNNNDRQNQMSFNNDALNGYTDQDGNKVKGLKEQLEDKVDEYNAEKDPAKKEELMNDAEKLHKEIHVKERQNLRNDYKIKRNEIIQKQTVLAQKYYSGEMHYVDYVKEYSKLSKERRKNWKDFVKKDKDLKARHEQESQDLANGKYDPQLSLGSKLPDLAQEQKEKMDVADQKVKQGQEGLKDAQTQFEEAEKACKDNQAKIDEKKQELDNITNSIEEGKQPTQEQQDQITKLEGEIETLENKQVELTAKMNEADENRAEKAADLNKDFKAREQMQKVHEAETKLAGAKEVHQRAQKLTEKALSGYLKADDAYRQIKNKIGDQNDLIAQKGKELEAAKKAIEKLSDNLVKQIDIVDKQQVKVDGLKAELAKDPDNKELQKDLKTQEENLQLFKNKLQGDNSRLRAVENEERKIETELKEAREQLQDLKELQPKAYAALKNAGKQLDELKATEKLADGKVLSAQKELGDLKGNIPKVEAPQVEEAQPINQQNEGPQIEGPQIEGPKIDGPPLEEDPQIQKAQDLVERAQKHTANAQSQFDKANAAHQEIENKIGTQNDLIKQTERALDVASQDVERLTGTLNKQINIVANQERKVNDLSDKLALDPENESLQKDLKNQEERLQLFQNKLNGDNNRLQEAVKEERKLEFDLVDAREKLGELKDLKKQAVETLDRAGEQLEEAKGLEQTAQRKLGELKGEKPKVEEAQPNNPQNEGPQDFSTRIQSLKETLTQQSQEIEQRMSMKFKPDESDKLGSVENQQKKAMNAENERATVLSGQQLAHSNVANMDSQANEHDNLLDPNDTPYESQLLDALDLASPSKLMTTQRDGELNEIEENSIKNALQETLDLATPQVETPKSSAAKLN